jgi:hypothetical protein
MPTRERSDAGTFVETVTLEAVRDVFTQVRGPVVTSSDVAAALECTTEAARQKLTRLYDRGEIDKRKTGRTVVYWREEESAGAPTDTARDDPDPSRGHTPGDTGTPTHADESGLIQDVRTYLEATDTGPKTDHGRGAVIDVFAYLREHGTAKTGELKQAVYPEYDDHYKSQKTMWESVYEYVKDTPGVEKAGYGQYRYAGDKETRETLREGS